MIATISPMEALIRCVAALKQIDRADCKDELVWQAIGDAQGTAEGVLRDYVEPEPVAYLRFRAAQSWSGSGNADIEHNEWLETCHAHEIGDDKLPAFPVYAAPVATQPAAAPQPAPELREVLRDALASGLTQTYGCSRTWSAWNVGTMTERDFYPADECDEILDELCDLAIAALGPFAATPAIAAPAEVERDAKLIEALHELALLMSDTIRGEYEPDSFTLQPAVHALAAVGIEFPDDDYLLTQRESCVVVPTKPTAAMLKAMAESRAVDDEGEFPAMLDLLDFSGENKTRTVLEAAYVAAIDAAIATGEKHDN